MSDRQRREAFHRSVAAVIQVLEQLDDEGYTGKVELECGEGIAHAWGKVAPVRRRPLRIIERPTQPNA